MDTASSTATAAEKRPVCSTALYVCGTEKGDRITHENEDAFGVLLPAVGYAVVPFLPQIRIQGEEWSRAVAEFRFLFQLWWRLRWLILSGLRLCGLIYTALVNLRMQGQATAKIPGAA
jgi:hypothetical protein